MDFSITSISSVFVGYSNERDLRVYVQMDSKEWTKIKNKKQLGHLYGVAISNEVYRIMHKSVVAWNPSVDDSRRASKGIKTLVLRYPMTEKQCQALAVDMSSYSTLLYAPKTSSLRLVGA